MRRLIITLLLLLVLANGLAVAQLANLSSGYYINNGSHFLLYEEPIRAAQLSLPQSEFFSANPHINAIQQLEAFPTRIVNGKRIPCQLAPYQAALHYRGLFICGGSILSPYFVLTAAHCVENTRGRFDVRVGSTQQRRGGQQHRVKFIIANARYNNYTMKNDLALLRLATPIRYGICAQPIRLPSNRRKYFPPCYLVSGWGLAKETAANVQRYLRGTSVCHVPRKRCNRLYNKANIRIYRQMLCAARKGHDSCSGDSGGPLAHKGTLYGVVSFGVGCADINFPGVYVNVNQYKKWIRRTMKRFS